LPPADPERLNSASMMDICCLRLIQRSRSPILERICPYPKPSGRFAAVGIRPIEATPDVAAGSPRSDARCLRHTELECIARV